MSTIARILLSGLIGAIICASLSFLTSFLVMVFGDVKIIEAFAYGFVVGVVASFIGAIIGLAIGIGNLGGIGGGIIGILGTLIGVTYLTFTATNDPSQYGYYLKASGLFSIKFYLPTIVTGIITALIMKKIYKP